MADFEASGGIDPWDPERIKKYGGTAYTGSDVSPVVPTAVPNPSMPKIQLSGGSVPDYASLIQNDPAYLMWQNNSQLDLATAAAQRREALRKLAIQYGGLAPGTKDLYGDIDQGTLELAGKNEYSDKARLARTYAQGIEAFKRALAARGGLQSGELGYGLDQAQTAQGEREYDLGNSFANAAQGVVNNYVGAESGVRRSQYDALRAAQASILGNPAYAPTGSVEAQLVNGSESQYGFPVYRGPDGSLYKADGSLFDPASFVAPTSSGGAVPGAGWTIDPTTGQLVYGGVRRAEDWL